MDELNSNTSNAPPTSAELLVRLIRTVSENVNLLTWLGLMILTQDTAIVLVLFLSVLKFYISWISIPIFLGILASSLMINLIGVIIFTRRFKHLSEDSLA